MTVPQVGEVWIMEGLNPLSGSIPLTHQGTGLSDAIGLSPVNWSDLNGLEVTVLFLNAANPMGLHGMTKAFVKDNRTAWFICNPRFFEKRKEPEFITRVGGSGFTCCSSGQCNLCKREFEIEMAKKGMVRNPATKFWEKKRS